VPGDHAGADLAHGADPVEGGVHVREARHDGERPVPLQFLVVVDRVRGQHDRPFGRRDGGDRLAGGVPADLGQLDAGRYLTGPAGQGQPAGLAHHHPGRVQDRVQVHRPGEGGGALLGRLAGPAVADVHGG